MMADFIRIKSTKKPEELRPLNRKIKQYKYKLRIWANKLGYIPEYFGQPEGRKLQDEYKCTPWSEQGKLIFDFEEWARDYEIQHD